MTATDFMNLESSIEIQPFDLSYTMVSPAPCAAIDINYLKRHEIPLNLQRLVPWLPMYHHSRRNKGMQSQRWRKVVELSCQLMNNKPDFKSTSGALLRYNVAMYTVATAIGVSIGKCSMNPSEDASTTTARQPQ